MGPELLPILFGLGVAAVLIVGYLSHLSRKRRQQAFAAVAAHLGLTYTADDPFAIDSWGFALFGKGDGRGVENVLHGQTDGLHVRMFDYWYYERRSDGKGGSSKTYYRFTCAVTPIEAACAHLMVDEEGLLSRIAAALTLKDIQFESEGFNRRFHVRCDDPAFAHTFVDARMIAWMLAEPDGQVYEVMGDKLLLIRRQIDPAGLPDLLGSIRGFAGAVPRVVFSLYPWSG
jgi:hypothetical protein